MNNILINIFNGLITLVGIYLTRTGAKSDLKAETKLLRDLVSGLENRVNILEAKDEKSEKESLFKKSFKNVITTTSSININNDSLLKDNSTLISILTLYSNEITDFGLKYHFSDLRNNNKISKETFESYLKSGIDSIMLIFIHMLTDSIKEERAYMHGNQVVCTTFVEYVASIGKINKEPDLFAYNEILINDLVANGLDESKLLTKFVTYIENFINSFKKKYKDFSKLELYDKYLEDKM